MLRIGGALARDGSPSVGGDAAAMEFVSPCAASG